MAVICPTVMGFSDKEYRTAIDNISDFAERVHIDFADGDFAPSKLIAPADAWWPIGLKVDFHIMYRRPLEILEDVVAANPHLVIIHAEAEQVHEFLTEVGDLGIMRGLALLHETPVEALKPYLDNIDHVLIFSGDLGHYDGTADLSLLSKVEQLKALKPSLEIGWDGGINDHSARALADGGVEVLNVGGYIQKAHDPEEAYDKLMLEIR